MKLTCMFPPTMDTPEHIRIAESLGYESAFVYDSPTFLADPWITLAQAAERTTTIALGTAAITPKLRHLVANAGAIATLSMLAPGRVEIVVGSGFTSQLMIGQRPARWSEVEAYVEGLKSLLRGEDLEWDGATIGFRHGEMSGIKLPIEVPIRVAAHGPKGYAVAERSADGLVTNLDHGSANTGAFDMKRALIIFHGTVLEEGETLDCVRVIDAVGPAAAFQLHLGSEGIIADTPEAVAYEEHISKLPPNARHLEIHRGHLVEVTEAERPLLTAGLIGSSTGTGTPEEVEASLAGIEAAKVEGVLYGPQGHDIPRELEAFAGCLTTAPVSA